jgi:hypothetical protein
MPIVRGSEDDDCGDQCGETQRDKGQEVCVGSRQRRLVPATNWWSARSDNTRMAVAMIYPEAPHSGDRKGKKGSSFAPKLEGFSSARVSQGRAMARRLVVPAACSALMVGPISAVRAAACCYRAAGKRASGGLLFEALGNLRDGGAAATSRALD